MMGDFNIPLVIGTLWRSPADQEVRGSNPTLAKREFLREQEMNHISEAPLDQGVNWYPERGFVCRSKIFRMLAAHKSGREIVSPGVPKPSFLMTKGN